jgi:hypothetical protein
VFIVAMKSFITSIKDNVTVHNKVGAAILQSPLRAIIPKELSFNKMQNNIKKGGKTPQTQLLYAYT